MVRHALTEDIDGEQVSTELTFLKISDAHPSTPDLVFDLEAGDGRLGRVVTQGAAPRRQPPRLSWPHWRHGWPHWRQPDIVGWSLVCLG